MHIKNSLKLILAIALIEAARGQESSEYFRQDLVTLLPDETEVVRSVNDSTLMTCLGTDIKWISPHGQVMSNKVGRVHVSDMSQPLDDVHKLQLMFVNIEKKDVGNWTCKGNYGVKSFNLIVFDPITFRPYTQDYKGYENVSATIRCAAEGFPTPEIHWQRNGQPVPETSHYKKVSDGLFFDRVYRNDSGTYICKAVQKTSQKIIEVRERDVRLDVLYKPVITNSYRMMALNGQIDGKTGKRIKYGFFNSSVELICEATGNPSPEIHWYHKKNRISHKMAPTVNGSAILTIHIKHNESYGEYKCIPENEVGPADEPYIVHLERGREAQRPLNFTLLGVGSDRFHIYVGISKEDPDDPMRVTDYRFEMMLKDNFESYGSMWKFQNIKDMKANGSDSSYIIDKLAPNKTYLVRVASINAAGVGEFTEIKEFTTIAYTPVKSSKKGSSDASGVTISLGLMITAIFLQYQMNIH